MGRQIEQDEAEFEIEKQRAEWSGKISKIESAFESGVAQLGKGDENEGELKEESREWELNKLFEETVRKIEAGTTWTARIRAVLVERAKKRRQEGEWIQILEASKRTAEEPEPAAERTRKTRIGAEAEVRAEVETEKKRAAESNQQQSKGAEQPEIGATASGGDGLGAEKRSKGSWPRESEARPAQIEMAESGERRGGAEGEERSEEGEEEKQKQKDREAIWSQIAALIRQKQLRKKMNAGLKKQPGTIVDRGRERPRKRSLTGPP